jgi:hypothetical protein
MNPRIKELAEEAGLNMWVNGNNEVEFSENEKRFAELIVKECADITSGLSKLFPRTDVAFDVGYTMGTTRATKEIKKHFGVKK